jgi:uncharacterized membrane protein YgcG
MIRPVTPRLLPPTLHAGRRLLAAVAVAILALVSLVLLGAPARAADQGSRSIDRYHATYTVQQDGSVKVDADFDFNFGNLPGHGPYLTLPLLQGNDSPSRYRSYPISGVTASSPSGAPANVNIDQTNGWLEIRIGDPSISNVSGVQSYQLHYTITAVVNTIPAQAADATHTASPAHQEFFWNAIGNSWETPLNNLSIDVVGPVEATQVQCYAGAVKSTTPCASATITSDGRAAFTQAHLEAGMPFTVVAGYPAGTFPNAAPILVDKGSVGSGGSGGGGAGGGGFNPSQFAPKPSPFAVTPVTGGLAGVMLLGGVTLAARTARRRARDEQYLGLTPGLAPAANQGMTVGYRDKRAPIAVQFQPPTGFRAGQLGTLTDERADPRDVTATIVDLAVRGYLRIEQTQEAGSWGQSADFRMLKLREADADLLPYEAKLFSDLFAARSEVALSQLRTTFAASMALVQKELYADVTQRGWFRSNPQTVRALWLGAAIGLAFAGVMLTVILVNLGRWAILGIPLIAIGAVVMFMARYAPARTADGTAVLAQTRGFEQYLRTAEANQIKYEEGEDLFSRYLPYAIVFGVAERWAGIFAQLAAQGQKLAEPTWYTGVGYGFGYGAFWAGAGSLGSSLSEFAHIADAAIAAPTPGASGGSGFGGGFGGGGFSGGGGGGGGGGGW